MSRLLRLYPRRWRSRYAREVEALLEELPPSPTDAVDLALGALRAHFSSTRPGGPAPSAPEGALMVFDLRHRFSRKDRLGAVAAVILFPGALFLCLSLLKYTFGMAAPFDSAAPVYLAARPVEYATFLTPFVAFAVALVPILGLKLERSAGTLRATLELEARPLNVVVAVASGLVAAAFLGYLFLENVAGRMHLSP